MPIIEDALKAHPSATLGLTINVGFAGHRQLDRPELIAPVLDESLRLLRSAVQNLQAKSLGYGDSETFASVFGAGVDFRLITGDAKGADRLAIDRWRHAGMGGVHVLYPFCDPQTRMPLTDDPSEGTDQGRVSRPTLYEASTVLDSVSLGLGGGEGHAELARWIIRHCPILIAVWTGAAAAGRGGTADTVERALERGLAVIWVNASTGALSLIDPHLWLRHVRPAQVVLNPDLYRVAATESALQSLLQRQLGPPEAGVIGHRRKDAEIEARRDYAEHDPLRTSWFDRMLERSAWRAFAVFKGAAGGLRRWRAEAHRELDVKATPEAAAPSEELVGPGVRLLREDFERADQRADRLGSIHRSQQLLLTLIAVIAVLFGSLSALAPIKEEQAAHMALAAGELLLAAISAAFTFNAAKAHRHHRWSDARRLAERLRAVLATWPLNVDIADGRLDPPQTWTEWRTRAVLHRAGPPQGLYDKDAFVARAKWGASQLIDGQALYHAKESYAAAHIEKFLDDVKTGAFFLLCVTLTAFLAAGTWAFARGFEIPHWVIGLVTVVSATSPAVAAAALSLEATNGFAESALKSAQIKARYQDLSKEIQSLNGVEHVHMHHMQEMLRSAATLHVDDADSWRDRAIRRKIASPG